jgi:hypothetical protein
VSNMDKNDGPQRSWAEWMNVAAGVHHTTTSIQQDLLKRREMRPKVHQIIPMGSFDLTFSFASAPSSPHHAGSIVSPSRSRGVFAGRNNQESRRRRETNRTEPKRNETMSMLRSRRGERDLTRHDGPRRPLGSAGDRSYEIEVGRSRPGMVSAERRERTGGPVMFLLGLGDK